MLSRLSVQRKARTLRSFWGTFFAFVALQSFNAFAAKTQINVMAPLGRIQNWDKFRGQLASLKQSGVYGITTDIWWGEFEAQGDQQFEWDYYKTYAQVVADSGMQWIPILSFHQCGGNVGDDCNVPLPSWIWKLGSEADMKFRDERGFVNGEYVSHFFDPIHQQYAEAMKSFAENFQQFQGIIPKIYLSLGPAGELRYPSYYGPAGWSFPNRGTFQVYGASAQRHFSNYAYQRYNGDLRALNAAWNSKLKSFNEVDFPTDGDRFFADGVRTPYGHDFLSWYQGRLIRHMQIVTRLAHENISPLMPSLKFGAKMSGVHWQHSSPTMPRAAEYAAGYYNYEEILRALKDSGIELTFTCLEMDDSDKFRFPMYSAPRSIVEEISTIARRIGLTMNGENALAISNNPARYDNIASVLNQYTYKSFTLLRMQNIIDSQGRPTSEMWVFRDKILRPFSPSWVEE